MLNSNSRGRGRGSKYHRIDPVNPSTYSPISERLGRSNGIPAEPYRSQSMAILPEKYHYQNQENGTMNKTNTSSGRKPSSDQQRKSTSRSSAGRARSTRPLRETIRSAVPDSSIISMAKRPDRGGIGRL